MSKFTDAIKAALKAYFETGDQPTEGQFGEVFDRIQEGIQEHGHTSSGGAGAGSGDAGPVVNLQSGTAASKPANPEVGDCFLETDTSKLYVCFSADTWTEIVSGSGEAPDDAYVCVRDKKAQNVDGGTFEQGAWRTRDINEELADTAGICSLASDQITLPAGTYRCHISAPAYRVIRHQLRLYNVTDSSVVLLGVSAYASDGGSGYDRSVIVGRFTLEAQKTLEVQHRCESTYDTYGFGVAAGFANEIYLIAEFWREA